MKWLESELRNLVAAAELAALLGDDTVVIALPLALRTLFELRAPGDEWLDMHLTGTEAAQRTGDRAAEADLHHGIARAYLSLGRSAEGIDGLRRALAIWQAQGNLTGQATARRNLSIAYYESGRLSDGIRECEQVAALARESGDLLSEGQALCDLGWMLQRVAQPAKAVVAASAALELGEHTGNEAVQAQAHHILGDALSSTGHQADGCSHWRAALAVYQELADPRADEMAARLERNPASMSPVR
jgi:tetratricopeptide (TPR) repeat protein